MALRALGIRFARTVCLAGVIYAPRRLGHNCALAPTTGDRDMPMRDELPPVSSRSSARVSAQAMTQKQVMASEQVRSTIFNTELKVIAAICAIGYLTALNVMLRVPEMSSMLSAYTIF
jgi:hypothetical protein